MNERIGIHEYMGFLDRPGVPAKVREIIKEEAEHGLELMELIPTLCRSNERALIEPDHLEEMRTYFEAQQRL